MKYFVHHEYIVQQKYITNSMYNLETFSYFTLNLLLYFSKYFEYLLCKVAYVF